MHPKCSHLFQRNANVTNATVVQAFSSGKIRANSRFSASTIATRYRNEAAVRSIEPGADKNGSSLSHVGSRVRSEFACNEVDDGGEIAVGAIAAGFGLGRLDKAVDAFEDAVVDAGGEPAQDAMLMATDGFRDVDDSRDAAVGGPEVPLGEESFGLLGWLVEKVLEGEADLVCASGYQVGIGDV